MLKKFPKSFLLILGGIFFLNILQAYFTEIIFDEAYYWHFAKRMAWGYFDHPPMVALLIKISSIFFENELGVRFMSSVLSAGTFILLWLLIDSPKKKDNIPLFFVFGLSMSLINAYGFLTLPDTPLVFFTALFLWIYKRFLKRPNYAIALLLGVSIAALMYSKYHAVLIIVLVILSNTKLLTNRYAWTAVIVALLLYTPHFMWLADNNFVSIEYHLFERPKSPYSFEKFTLAFFVNLVAILGFTFPWVYKTLYQTKANHLFTKTLLYLTYGFIVFFFISSFKVKVQTQWVIVISIPLFILTYTHMLSNINLKKWVYRMAIVNCIILGVLRIGLIYKPLFPIYYETHGNKFWTSNIQSQIGDMPVVFENSYRSSSMYSFYTRKKAFSLNNVFYRKNQYSIDSTESQVQHQKVLYVTNRFKEGDIAFKSIKGKTSYGRYIDNFESYRKLRCYFNEDLDPKTTDKLLQLKVYNPYLENIPLHKLKFAAAYLDRYKKVKDLLPIALRATNKDSVSLKANDTTNFMFKLPSPKMKDPYHVRIVISENGLFHGINSTNVKLQ